MGIGEAYPAEVGHGVALDPHDVVQDPVAEILQDATHAVDIVIRADHPQRSGGFEHAPALAEPPAREVVVSFKAFKLIPILGDPVHLADIRTPEVALQLQVVGRVGKDQIDRICRQARQYIDTVAFDNGVDPGLKRIFGHGVSIVLVRESNCGRDAHQRVFRLRMVHGRKQ